MSKKALVVEDDVNIAELLMLYLEKDGFEVSIAHDGGRGIEMFNEISPDLVLLDIMMPVMDGMQVCREIRKTSSVPIIMLTAKGAVGDKVAGLDIGADDYVTKPFEVKELLARIHAVMRRSETDNTPKEMELLYHLAASPNIVFTRNQLLDEVWGFDYFGDSRTVDVHIKRLREKLEGVSPQWSLQTVWGVGYKFEVVK